MNACFGLRRLCRYLTFEQLREAIQKCGYDLTVYQKKHRDFLVSSAMATYGHGLGC